jgi:hypothetical protein
MISIGIIGRKDQKEAAHLAKYLPIRPKFIGNSSASALLTARRLIRVLRVKGKPAVRGCPQSPKGVLGIGGSWAAEQSGGAAKNSASTE